MASGKTKAGIATVIGSIITGVIVAYFSGMFTSMFGPKTTRATLSKLTVESGVTLEKYLKRSSLPSNKYTPEEFQQIGYVINFQVEIEGFAGKKCVARWSVYDTKSKSKIELPDPWADVQEPIQFTPEHTIDTAAEYFWVPVLDKDTTFFVRVELYDHKGAGLTFADTEPINPKSRLEHR